MDGGAMTYAKPTGLTGSPGDWGCPSTPVAVVTQSRGRDRERWMRRRVVFVPGGAVRGGSMLPTYSQCEGIAVAEFRPAYLHLTLV